MHPSSPRAALAAAGGLVLLVATSPGAQTRGAASPTGRALQVSYMQFQLANGLNVILHEDHSVPIVSVNMWYHVGSGREKPGRTGFAHLFEHLMFEGSKHVKEGEFDRLLEGVGGDNNGSTNTDRTNYWINVPSNALETALFLESDRMGFLLDVMSPARVDGQRDVVKNERRQNYENRPYGLASIVIGEMMYPDAHPYHWPTIGYMDDLTAASYDDVVEFFRRYYGPGTASLVVAGDLEPSRARQLVEKWFGEIPRGQTVDPIDAPPVVLREVKRRTLEDRVQLERLYLAWPTPPLFAPADAALDIAAGVLAVGKNSRLYKRLVYDMQVAQDVSAFQSSSDLASAFLIIVTARPGHTAAEMKQLVDEELAKLRTSPPDAREVERAINQAESSFYRGMERVGGFGGKADQLNSYYFNTGNPDYFAEDLARYQALSANDIQAAVLRHLPPDRRIELTVVPQKATKPSAEGGR